MIALWLIYRKNFSARAAISYVRLCRCGSVMGIQQFWLVFMEKEKQMQSSGAVEALGVNKLHREGSQRSFTFSWYAMSVCVYWGMLCAVVIV